MIGWLKEACKLPIIYEPEVIFENGVPIDFKVPFGQRQIEILCRKINNGSIGRLYATTDVLIANSEEKHRFVDAETGKDREIFRTDLDEETMRTLLKLMYGVDSNYRRPFSDEDYLKLYRGAKEIGLTTVRSILVEEIKMQQNAFLGFIVSEIPDKQRCCWLRNMTVCEITKMSEHPEYSSTRGELFSNLAISVMLQVFIEDRRRPPFSICCRCGQYLHKPRLIALNLN